MEAMVLLRKNSLNKVLAIVLDDYEAFNDYIEIRKDFHINIDIFYNQLTEMILSYDNEFALILSKFNPNLAVLEKRKFKPLKEEFDKMQAGLDHNFREELISYMFLFMDFKYNLNLTIDNILLYQQYMGDIVDE